MDKKERMRSSYAELPEGEESSPAKVVAPPPAAAKKDSWRHRDIRIVLKKGKTAKEKNDPERFSGEGVNFRAKIIGIDDVFDARGNRMCQGALQKLKAAAKTSGDHKQRIIINISLNGIIIKEEKTGEVLYHHPIHKISFISQDTKNNRTFGYVYGCPQTGHRFFAIKTEKSASQVVVTLRDLFLVALEIKKSEIERGVIESPDQAAGDDESGQEVKNDFTSDSYHFSEESIGDSATNHGLLYLNSVLLPDESTPETQEAVVAVEASNSLLDLQSEVDQLNQGISQMDQSIANAVTQNLGISVSEDDISESSASSYQTAFQLKLSSLYHETLSMSSRSSSTSDYYNNVVENRPEDPNTPKKIANHGVSAGCSSGSLSGEVTSSVSESHCTSSTTDSGTEDRYAVFLDIDSLPSIFDDPSIGKLPEKNLSDVPVTSQNGSAAPSESYEPEPETKTSTLVAFSELDPLGNQPYVDKKDFFHEIKNPPKKVLKDLAGTNGSESGAFECFNSDETNLDNQRLAFSNGVMPPLTLPPKRDTVPDFEDSASVSSHDSWESKQATNPFNPFLLNNYPDIPPPSSPPPPPPPRLPMKIPDSSPPRPPSRENGIPTPPLPRRKVPLSSANRAWFSFDQDADAKPSLPSPVRKLPPPKPHMKSSSASNSPATMRRLNYKSARSVAGGEVKILGSCQPHLPPVAQESNPFVETQEALERCSENCSPPLPPKPAFISPGKKLVPYSSSGSSTTESSSGAHSSSSLPFSSPCERRSSSGCEASSSSSFLSSSATESSQADIFRPQSSNGADYSNKPADSSPESIFHRKEDPFADDFFLSLHKKSSCDPQAVTKTSPSVLDVSFDNLEAPT